MLSLCVGAASVYDTLRERRDGVPPTVGDGLRPTVGDRYDSDIEQHITEKNFIYQVRILTKYICINILNTNLLHNQAIASISVCCFKYLVNSH
jgi:hypothetical protein